MKSNKWYLLLQIAAVVIVLTSIFVLKATAGEESNIYGQPIKFKSSAYCWTGNPTKSGVYPMEGRTIAVDPKVIPLGSTVIIYTEDMEMLGIFQAEDTGRLIKGEIIDIYMEDKPTCIEWGRRSIYVQVIPDAVG